MGARSGEQVDHINGDTLDNRIRNLRICSCAENLRNRGITKNNSSGFKGMSWHKECRRWQARIKYLGRDLHIGLFDDLFEAARAYDKKAAEIFGKFARFNFPIEAKETSE
jgi:hypothetical protein